MYPKYRTAEYPNAEVNINFNFVYFLADVGLSYQLILHLPSKPLKVRWDLHILRNFDHLRCYMVELLVIRLTFSMRSDAFYCVVELYQLPDYVDLKSYYFFKELIKDV